MPVITINGEIGSGGTEIGARVAQELDIDYVDRMILAEAANRLGATLEAVAEREQRPVTRADRFARFLQSALERSATTGTGGDPYFGPGLGTMLGREYQEISQEPITKAQELDDQKFMEVTQAVVNEVAASGNAVIIGRGSNLTLRDYPNAFHVGLVASMEHRFQIVAARENLPSESAERRVTLQEKARRDFLGRFFGALPDNPEDYDLVLNTSRIDHQRATAVILEAMKS